MPAYRVGTEALVPVTALLQLGEAGYRLSPDGRLEATLNPGDRRLVIDYVDIPKTPGRELTWLQWLMTWRKNPAAQEPIPAKTIIEW